MKKIAPTLALLSVLTSCGMNTAPKDLKNMKLVNANIISIRSNLDDAEAIMVRLKTPALIETAKIEGQKITIDENQKALVLKEQEEFVKKVKELDPNAEVLYSTKIVMNAVTIVAKPSIMNKVNGLSMVRNANTMSYFAAPDVVTRAEINAQMNQKVKDLTERTSVNFIGAGRAKEELGITGKGLRIGIIDTGIDYTHTMFGGSGSIEEFKSIDPTAPVASYPHKIEGGIDLVGDEFSPASPVTALRIPRPDMNPLDVRSGHGTHVAGTVAGIGDGVNTYDGVASGATMHGIKVFGKNSTGDAIVIAALEYSVDPNGDLDPSDRLDIVNLSLGGAYGKPSINYAEAVKNTVLAGVSFVAAAGNSGDAPYIVGAPSTATEALSVAAGIDNMVHNVTAVASQVSIDGQKENMYSPLASFSKALADGEVISGDVAFIGLGDRDLTAEEAAKVAGKVALVDRGAVAFTEKAERALKAGAIGVVIANNVDGEPTIAGGSDNAMSIPVVSISKADGEKIKAALNAKKEIEFSFSNEIKVSRMEYADTITSFSSRGPRSEDGLIKPEIVAPGQQIISAATGKGNGGVALNGTSMASPHMAGVMALMKEKFPELSVMDYKHMLMATAKIIGNEKGERYSVTAQGAGRVDIMKALTSKLVPSRGAFSLGLVNLLASNKVAETITLKNISDEDLNLSISTDFRGGITLAEKGSVVTIKKGESKEVKLSFTLDVVSKNRANFEGFVKLVDASNTEIASFPVLAVVHQASALNTIAKIQSDKKVSFVLSNNSSIEGKVLPFNLIAEDARKESAGELALIRNTACDLQSAGFRVMNKTVNGKEKSFLQVGVKLFDSVSDWQACEISVLIDADKDGVADLEWAGTNTSYIPGLAEAIGGGFASVLVDAKKAQALRASFEESHISTNGNTKAVESYIEAILYAGRFTPFHESSVSVIEIDLEAVSAEALESLDVKVAALHTGAGAIEADDFLGTSDSWHKLSIKDANNLPESIEVQGFGKKMVSLPKNGSEIILYSPTNADGGKGGVDLQSIKL